ncbi:MAG: glycosyltransferase family 4 protein [Bacteroidia bacterium]|nr:glycosyltransferase family 4 protein [Bacteroidia bacterium]MDW8348113.1 glycosyltransferase family 1 protein [Bacteroidia bacterium]
MRIAINTRFLLKGRLEGIGRFTLEITQRLVKKHPNDTFYFIFDRPYDKSFIFSENVIPVVVSPPARHPILWKIWCDWSVKRYLDKIKPDVYFSPDGYLPLKTDVPCVPVIHDLAFEHYPNDVPKRVLNFYRKHFPKYAHKAKHIIAVSEYTKRDIVEQYGVPVNKITVAYNAVSEIYAPSSEVEQISTRQKYTQGKPYFLFVGAIHPRKNVVNLLKSFDEFKKQYHTDHKLVIVGRKAWDYKDALQVYEQMEYKGEVVFTGHLEVEELRLLYGAAVCLVYISYFEGFGIPIIEALSCGCPVITSNVSSMPEVVGKAGLLVDPLDVQNIVRMMQKVALQTGKKEELLTHVPQQLSLFDWEKSADKVYQVIKQVATT